MYIIRVNSFAFSYSEIKKNNTLILLIKSFEYFQKQFRSHFKSSNDQRFVQSKTYEELFTIGNVKSTRDFYTTVLK